MVEKLWQEFFKDPSQWWDNRAEKVNARYPDFKHKDTEESLWLNGKFNPQGVELQVAAMPPGALQVDIFTWNKRLRRYVKNGQPEKTLELFGQMQKEGMKPDKFTFVPVLNACSSLHILEEGRRIHGLSIECGHGSDLFVGNALVDMYVKCGSIEEAGKVFRKMPTRDVVSWNAMILGYSKCGQGQTALKLSLQMQQEGVDPDSITFVAMLNACANVGAIEEGRRLHKKLVERGFESDVYVANSLVDMYGNCGCLEDAWRVFNKMPIRGVVSWNAMILGCVKCGKGHKALDLFQQMQQEGVHPDAVNFAVVLNACATVEALEEGRRVHELIIRTGHESDVFLGNCLIDMYAKCGSIDDARRVFIRLSTHDAGSWNIMLGGYALHGRAKEAVGHFHQMCQKGVEMNGITFLSLLSACSHGGLLDDGLHYFETMCSVYGIFPTLEHFASVIDLLGRGGRLHEAEDLIKVMSWEPNAPVWKSLLSACRVHGNLEIGERSARGAVDLDPENSAGYLLLSNIHAAVERLDRSTADTSGDRG